ncbi:MAG: hypothetical protein QM426_06985 [Euryarchaeota archaeon]|nr:hypothetical protein [Euryarchaeota archaeon]
MFHLARKIVTALENKYLDIDPHPSVRLLGKRDAYTIISERSLRRKWQMGRSVEKLIKE